MNRHPQAQFAAGRAGRSPGGLRFACRVAGAARTAGLLVLVGLLACGSALRAAETETPMDYQVKAAFLVNFPKFVDWEPGTFAETNSPIVVGIFGDDNVAGEFQKMIEGGRTVAGRPIALERITTEQQISTNCQILFIARSERHRVPAILQHVRGGGVLTVGETENFLDNGGIINLVPRDRKIRLQVNLGVARSARLNISSRLLKVADVVKGKPE